MERMERRGRRMNEAWLWTIHPQEYMPLCCFLQNPFPASFLKKYLFRASLVAQWLRIRLPMQGHGFDTWSGKIPHAAEQLSPCITTTEPASHNY